MENKKPVPLGIENFKKVKEECYYVDKTKLIKQIVNEPSGSAMLFARPRRFGKSLAISMLKHFFEIEEGKDEGLFSDTSIYKEKEIFSSNFGAFPVVYINFKNISGANKDELLSQTAGYLQGEYSRHEYLLHSNALNEYEKRYYQNILSNNADYGALASSLHNLTGFLHKHYGKEAIILIDEYDAPIRLAYEKGYYEEAMPFFRSLFGSALKGNDHLHYGILTGILQVGKESIFSGLNNLNVVSVLDEAMDEGFGFTEKEVDDLLAYYGLTEKKDDFRDWYDGYLFGNTKIYNPLSVLGAVKKDGKMGPYWLNTSEKSELYALLTQRDLDISFLSDIMVNKQALCEVDLAISYRDLDNPRYLPSYLLATGYLTVEKEFSYDSYLLKIPNKEIESIFEKEIVGRYLPRNGSDLPDQIRLAFLNEEGERIKSLLEREVLDGFSYYDFGSEKAYQIMVLSVLALALKNYKVKTKANAASGRSDIIAFPKKEGDPGMIIETKLNKGRLSSSRLLDSSLFALKQIEERDYMSLFHGSNVKQVLLYGLSFAGKNVAVSTKKTDLA